MGREEFKTVLKVDYDGKSKRRILKRIKEVYRFLFSERLKMQEFKTRHGWHFEIYLTAKLKPAEIVAVQTMMGSDYRREMINLLRTRIYSEREFNEWGNVLFKKSRV